jgi:hypothetical protein
MTRTKKEFNSLVIEYINKSRTLTTKLRDSIQAQISIEETTEDLIELEKKLQTYKECTECKFTADVDIKHVIMQMERSVDQIRTLLKLKKDGV